MNRIILCLAVALCGFSPALRGQFIIPSDDPDAAATPAPAAGKADLDKVVAAYDAQEKAIDDEITPKINAANTQYASDLEFMANKYDQAKRLAEEDKVKEEEKRYASHGLEGEPDAGVPTDVRVAWKYCVQTIVDAKRSVAYKRSGVRFKYGQDLTALELRYRADARTITLIHQARAAVTIRTAIEEERITSTDIAGKADGAWVDVAWQGGYVVGFTVGKGSWYQFKVLGTLTPIYATAHGLVDGERRGKSGSDRIIARDGYAVGGLTVRNGDVVNCLQIVFMRINPDGLTLNPQDSYSTDWLGGEGGSTKPRELNTHGHLVVGVIGKSGDIVDGAGLVYLK